MHVYHNYYKKTFTFFLYYIRMNRKNINFDDKETKKNDFYKKNKKIFNIDDIDVSKILVSKKETYGKNNSLIYFIGYTDNDVIRPLCLRFSKMTGYINNFKDNTTAEMSLRLMINF